MKLIIGGAIAIILSICGFAAFFQSFLIFLAGVIPIALIAGGALALYIYWETRGDDNEFSGTDTAVPQSSEKAARQDQDPPGPAAAAGDKVEKPLFTGNTDTLVYHTLDCNFATSKKCTESFFSKTEAEQKGYKPCKICQS